MERRLQMAQRQHRKVDFKPGKIWFAEEQAAIDGDDRMASVRGYGCEGEGGGSSLYLGWGPRYSHRTSKEGVQKIVMVEMSSIKKMCVVRSVWRVWLTSLPP
jgi:hypothetical protein